MGGEPLDVVIVGAGPTGLTLAGQLQALGASFRIVDRQADRVHESRALAVRLFGLGLADTAFPFLLFVSQAETEALLGDRLTAGGARVERSVELTAFSVGDDRVAYTLRHPDGRTEQVDARYLVGCDGAASGVRRGAGIPFRGGAYPQTFALADLEIDGDLETDSATASSARRASCSAFR